MKSLYLLLFLALGALLAPAASGQTILRKGDVFDLRLTGVPSDVASEFFVQYTVGDDGKVKIPYIGEMNTIGISTTELARNIEKRLVSEKIFTSPTIIITVQQGSRFVTVGGEVRSPQTVAWSPDLTLSLAVKRCGGAGEFGSLKKIKVTREGKSILFNLTKAEKDPNQNPKLMPGDEIEVL